MSAPGAHGSEATIYDVARAAGVSPSTVSRAFTKPGRVSAATEERIRLVADELGYRGRGDAPTRARAAAKVLGLWVSDVTDPFAFRVARGCLAAAHESGYLVVVQDSQDTLELEHDLIRRSLPLLDGVVVAGSRLTDAELRALGEDVPLVVLNRRIPGLTCLVPDVAEGVRMSAEHLHALGHRAVTYLSGPEGSWSDGMRWRAVRATAQRLGLAERRLGPLSATVQGGRGAAEAIAAGRVGAVLCANDLLGIGLLRGLQERGLSVPGDVSVVGFDNIVASAFTSPALTTVAVPFTRLGEAAARFVVAMAEHRRLQPVAPTLPVRLIVRESTGPPRS